MGRAKKYQDRDGLQERLIHIVSDGVRWQRTSMETIVALQERVFNTRDWDRMTASDRSFVNGYHAAYRRFVVDPLIESGDWFTMPDGSVRYRASFDPLPEGISHRYVWENRIEKRSGLFWKTSEAPGTKPYFISEPAIEERQQA